MFKVWIVLGIVVGIALLVGVGVVAYHYGGDMLASSEARKLAEHPWWKGRVKPGDVERILSACRSTNAGVVCFNKQGEFTVRGSGFLPTTPTPTQAEAYIFVGKDGPDLPNPPYRAVVISCPSGKRISYATAVDYLKEALDLNVKE